MPAPHAVGRVGVGLVVAHQLGDVVPDHFVGRALEERSASWIDVLDAAFAVDRDDGIGRGVEDRVRELETTPFGVAAALRLARFGVPLAARRLQ